MTFSIGRQLGVVVICGLVGGCIPGQKAYWDARVNELCARDGGITVFETVYLAEKDYLLVLNRFGELAPPLEKDAAPNVPIVRTYTTTYIRDGDPVVARGMLAVIRRTDRKVLATQVTYWRRGGDIPGPWQPTHFSCPQITKSLFAEAIKRRQ